MVGRLITPVPLALYTRQLDVLDNLDCNPGRAGVLCVLTKQARSMPGYPVVCITHCVAYRLQGCRIVMTVPVSIAVC